MNYVVFDLETKTAIQGFDKKSFNELEISVAGVYDSSTDTYHTFTEEEFGQMWPIFEKADVMIGYNSISFDLPLLNNYYLGDLSQIKQLDLMKEIQNSLGRRLRLDSVAEATLGKKKSGHGLDAVEWWNAGEVQKVKDYCEQDVRVTKEIYEYMLKNGGVKYNDFGKIVSLKIDTSDWGEKEDNAMTKSMF